MARHSFPSFTFGLTFALCCLIGVCVFWLLGLNSSSKTKVDLRPSNGNSGIADPSSGSFNFKSKSVGNPVVGGNPWVTDLALVDLDGNGLLDIVYCEGIENSVYWIRQNFLGIFEELPIARDINGPAHVTPVDMDFDGDSDLLISGMGVIMPNNGRIGSLVVLENLGESVFEKHVLLDQVARVTDAQAGDFDNDGDLDLAVGQFGYVQGEVRWMENMGDWKFRSHPLLDLSGTIHVPVADFDLDGDLDFVALVSQEWEEIHLFDNDGESGFVRSIVYGSTNEDYGSSGLELADIDLDGKLDLLYTNGDAFDFGYPGPRPWHGIQWLRNVGKGKFQVHRLGDFPGAYSPRALDLDDDGDVDIIAVSGFNNWEDPQSVSIMAYINDGSGGFSSHPLARRPTHFIDLEIGDLDNDGELELVTGSFHSSPPFTNMNRILIWDRE